MRNAKEEIHGDAYEAVRIIYTKSPDLRAAVRNFLWALDKGYYFGEAASAAVNGSEFTKALREKFAALEGGAA